jgi:hypothetical protein
VVLILSGLGLQLLAYILGHTLYITFGIVGIFSINFGLHMGMMKKRPKTDFIILNMTNDELS